MFNRSPNSEQLVQEVKKWTLKCTQLESHNSRLELDLKEAKTQFTTVQKVSRLIPSSEIWAFLGFFPFPISHLQLHPRI